ncbi:porin [Methylobacterium nodulans]|uniref:Porin n=1 Tax=Methylobacterium nodulans (strain LMG 21967 / CNCM I-2342 / ORS 2060) TaxID=460265 RepID=B8ILW7_METNO|nr:porin [Methylobacterium nodulans]ACL56311.1 porin [Methylobacterium nodulans ORS 2060]
MDRVSQNTSASLRESGAVKRLLLGSVAGLTVVAGAQAADLPVKKAAPVEYVRVCSAYGAGFFYIPGTDTCLRVGGRARFEATYVQPLIRGDTTGYRGLGRLNLDARTQTGYGTLRAFVRFELASRTGGFLKSGTQERIANAFAATGVDTAARVQQYVNVDKAFIQFAGLTAGRAASFFDFYAHDFEIIGVSLGSDTYSTNLLAYTATFGEGFSATISMEDPNLRRTPVFGGGSTGFTGSQAVSANFAPVLVTNAAGVPVSVTAADVIQRSRMPDFVGALRYDAAWGSAQLSAAVHEINAGNTSTLVGLTAAQTALLPATANPAARPANAYGWAVQGGLKLNLPFIAAGDALYLQGAYGEGAQTYTGYSAHNGSYTLTGSPAPGLFNTYYADAVVDPVTGQLSLSTSWTVVASYLHYWTPQWRSAFYGSYGEMSYNKAARFNSALFGVNGLPSPTTAAGVAALAISPVLRDTNQIVAGASLIWSPVKDLDIGVEGLYARSAVSSGRVINPNKASSATLASAGAAGGPSLAAVLATPTVVSQDTFQVRMRVQRDF